MPSWENSGPSCLSLTSRQHAGAPRNKKDGQVAPACLPLLHTIPFFQDTYVKGLIPGILQKKQQKVSGARIQLRSGLFTAGKPVIYLDYLEHFGAF
jgi:hypothetical protein